MDLIINYIKKLLLLLIYTNKMSKKSKNFLKRLNYWNKLTKKDEEVVEEIVDDSISPKAEVIAKEEVIEEVVTEVVEEVPRKDLEEILNEIVEKAIYIIDEGGKMIEEEEEVEGKVEEKEEIKEIVKEYLDVSELSVITEKEVEEILDEIIDSVTLASVNEVNEVDVEFNHNIEELKGIMRESISNIKNYIIDNYNYHDYETQEDILCISFSIILFAVIFSYFY